MKNSKKRIIEKYINKRCKKLQEQSMWDRAKNVAKTMTMLNPTNMMVNMATKPMRDLTKAGVETYKDYKAGDITKDQAWGHFGNKALDTVQTSLDGAGMIPAAGVIPDLANAAISQARASTTDDPVAKKKHNQNRNLSLGAAVPGAGLFVGGTKIITKNAPKLANMVTDVSKQIKYNPAYTPTKTGTKVYKADQKGHVTGEKGQVTDFVNQNVVQPAASTVQQAGTAGGGFLTNMYNKIKNSGGATNAATNTAQRTHDQSHRPLPTGPKW